MKSRPTSLIRAVAIAGLLAALETLIIAVPRRGWTLEDAMLLWSSEWGVLACVTMSVAVVTSTTPMRPVKAKRWDPLSAVIGLAMLVCLVAVVGQHLTAPLNSDRASGADVLVITMDTTRADALSVYGNTAVRTPNIDRLARGGVVFEQAVATAAQTGPSHLSILSGKYPFETGVYANATPIRHVELLTRKLRNAGWLTSAFVSGYPLHHRFGFDDGFAVYDAEFDGAYGLVGGRILRLLRGTSGRERRGDHTVERAIRWLEAVNGPIFSWIHLYDPHGPYTAPAPFGGTLLSSSKGRLIRASELPAYWPNSEKRDREQGEIEARYLEEIAWMDAQIGRLLAAYESARPDKTPMVILVADHGESYVEHGVIFDHGDDLYEPAMHIPLILSGGGAPRGIRSTCLVSTVDIVPTIADTLGVEPLPTLGRSLKSAFAISGVCPERYTYASTVGDRSTSPPIHHMIRADGAKLIRFSGRDSRYFDLSEDALEEKGLLPSEFGRPALFSRQLELRLGQGSVPVERELDDEVLQGLQQLGYVD